MRGRGAEDDEDDDDSVEEAEGTEEEEVVDVEEGAEEEAEEEAVEVAVKVWRFSHRRLLVGGCLASGGDSRLGGVTTSFILRGTRTGRGASLVVVRS